MLSYLIFKVDDNLNHALDKIIEEAEEKVKVNESTTENEKDIAGLGLTLFLQ